MSVKPNYLKVSSNNVKGFVQFIENMRVPDHSKAEKEAQQMLKQWNRKDSND